MARLVTGSLHPVDRNLDDRFQGVLAERVVLEHRVRRQRQPIVCDTTDARELAHMAAGSPLISRPELASARSAAMLRTVSALAAALPVTLGQLAEHLDALADTVPGPLPGGRGWPWYLSRRSLKIGVGKPTTAASAR